MPTDALFAFGGCSLLEWQQSMRVDQGYSVLFVVLAALNVLLIIWLARTFAGFGFELPLWKMTKGRRNG